MIVDVHSHATPRSVVEAIEREPARFGATVADGLVFNGRKLAASALDPQRSDVDRRLADMDAIGIDVQVLSPTPAFLATYHDDGWAAEIAAVMNAGIAAMAAESERFWAIGQLPLQSAERSLREIDHVMELGLPGVMVVSNAESATLDDASLEPVWARLDELALTVFVHPTNPKPQPRLEEFHLTNLLGNPFDTSIALGRLILSGVLVRYPRIRFYFAHGGGFIPYQFGRIDHAYRVRADTSSKIDVLPSSLLAGVWFDTITHAEASLRYLIETMGDTNVVVGTDYPADMADERIASTLAGLGIEPSARARVEHENAERLFGRT
jgi:aminocarboxymuconate-semialdehyde decarboxylase